jgi:hypothetical protein
MSFLHQSVDRPTLVVMLFDQHLASVADPAQFPHEACATEEIALHAQLIEATHLNDGPEDIELDRAVVHVVID